jgi:hypothetical protein
LANNTHLPLYRLRFFTEQSYFNYFLNKREFTNGLDMRNSYLHGTQTNPEEIQEHEYAYYSYLKLLTLILLKIEDDLLFTCSLLSKSQRVWCFSLNGST